MTAAPPLRCPACAATFNATSNSYEFLMLANDGALSMTQYLLCDECSAIALFGNSDSRRVIAAATRYIQERHAAPSESEAGERAP